MHRRIPAEPLLRQSLHEIFRQDRRKAGHVEDVFLGIERGELAADLIEIVDQAVRGAAHSRVKRREQSRRAGADDGDIFRVLHRANASVVLLIGLLAAACASSGSTPPGALGWSLGGEAHVFVAGDRYARDFYRELTGTGGLTDSLARRALVAVEAGKPRNATVLSANGAAPARLTLARFHARGTCGFSGIVTELVLAFPPIGTR